MLDGNHEILLLLFEYIGQGIRGNGRDRGNIQGTGERCHTRIMETKVMMHHAAQVQRLGEKAR